MDNILELNNVTRHFGEKENRAEILKDVNLQIKKGEFVAIVGFSGTGKSTLINLMGGLLEPSEGEVRSKGQPVTGPAPDRGVIFQNYSLLPWLSVEGNVGLAVNQIYKDKSKSERKAIIEKYVDMVSLSPAIHKKPKELSGGMRQRVSVARALSMDPDILLMDEPLSALDALTRSVLQDQILEIWRSTGKTIVLITNDVDEGIYMADRIIPISIGPNATLGPSFDINIPRPRERKTLNKNEEFRRLRAEVIGFLNEEKRKEKSNETTDSSSYPLPDIAPAVI
ncbi:ATPase component of various ABC-type transport systems [Lentisphaera araneosa HTCC2155]|uniref:ATPase component of various ABC-type transport systems n=1 Tax=Lentisphaera araneosa HTCC2155 TaxID=313628 RepID=A6DPB3_9BACT|nr:ABC transporter ATP-binding protein [Lentisphaera araneosa]EDM26645.1 ATPase component of various ABC-type transport systems [Lentisphaera araneosa HTCC2155]